MKYKSSLAIIFLITVTFVSCASQESNNNRPNIILIMADDMGYSDIGCYGGEIETPNIDRLANEGLRFRTFYNMAKCNPTRSSLLTGLYLGGNGAVHIAQLTKQAGYINIMCGKEHFFKWVPEYCRAENVFDSSFYFWAIDEYFLPPSGKFDNPFVLNGRKLRADEIKHKKSPMYKTDFITDYALDWIESASEKEEPFFLYLPYHVAHYPLQARPEDIAKYRGKYKVGWDSLRQQRFKKMKKLRVLNKSTKLSPPEKTESYFMPQVPEYVEYYKWDSRTEKQKDSLDLEMSVYAAMIDRMDQNIGRVLKKLEENGELENTLIMFVIDNGACPFYKNKSNVPPGPADSYWSLRTSWANLCNTPFRQYKQCGNEGGSDTPFIVYWPGVIKPNTFTNQPGHVVDMAPTLLEILGTDYPDSINGYKTIPLHGNSLLPIFKGEQRKEPDYFISGLNPHRMFRSGDYKLVKLNGGDWELYNMRDDPTELNNLADILPEKLEELTSYYEKVLTNLELKSEYKMR